MIPELSAEGKCRACNATVRPEWVSCPSCGTPLAEGPETRGPAAPARSEGADVDPSFVSTLGGAKRNVTIVDVARPPPDRGAVPLSGMFVHRRFEDRTPAQPHTPDPRRPVTVILPKPPEEKRGQKVDDVGEASSAMMETMAPEAPLEPAAEITPPSTNVAPTVVVVAPQRSLRARLSSDDLEEIRQMVDDAVRRSFQQRDDAKAAAESTAAGPAIQPFQRMSLAGVGAGLLLGGAIAGLIALNWDIWIRGAQFSTIGWLQQSGVVSAAVVAGAGAAVLALGFSQRSAPDVKLKARTRRK